MIALIFSAPLTVFPSMKIMDNWFFSDMAPTWKRFTLEKLGRAVIITLAITIAVVFSNSFSKFLAVFGSFLCSPLAFIWPAMLHMKLFDQTRKSRIENQLLIVVGIIVMFLIPIYTITISW